MGGVIEKRSATDKMLLTYARLSPEEIETETGIPANMALGRLNELLKGRSWMTLKQRELLLLGEIDDVITDAKRRLNDASDRDYAAIANVILKGVDHALQRITEARQNIEIDIYEITEGNATIFGKAYDVAVAAMFEELRRQHPGLLSDQKVNELKVYALDAAEEYLRDHIAEEND